MKTPATLSDFGNALRECLGLAPLYDDGRQKRRPTHVERFARIYAWPLEHAQTPRRKASL